VVGKKNNNIIISEAIIGFIAARGGWYQSVRWCQEFGVFSWACIDKLSHIYLYSALYNTNPFKAASQQ